MGCDGYGHHWLEAKWLWDNTGLAPHGQKKLEHGVIWPWEIDMNVETGVRKHGLITT